jgi:hypothetical protein
MLSGSFPIFALSNHTTFSQAQTGATVPLRCPNIPYFGLKVFKSNNDNL